MGNSYLRRDRRAREESRKQTPPPAPTPIPRREEPVTKENLK